MKINKWFVQYFCVIAFAFTVFNGCKDDTITETETNNNNQQPNSPELVSPSNNSTITATAPSLSWNSFTGASSYRIQLSMDANFVGTLRDTTISGTSINITPGILTTNTYYYWRVLANIQGGTSNWSAVWRFRIVLAPPPAPNLISPDNGATGVSFTPLFDWNDPPTAENFRLQISTNSVFSSIIFDSSGILGSGLQCPPFYLVTNTVYFWRVNASNSNGASISSWSSVFNFTTIPGPTPNSISGTIIFADTMFLGAPALYVVGVYETAKWPPPGYAPVKIDTLEIQLVGNVYQANYIIRNIPDGTYYLTSYASELLLSPNRYLGIYGCDTAHVQFSGCPLNPTSLTIVNNSGIDNINFISWADTAKAIF